MYTIINNSFVAKISEIGAELKSFTDSSGVEYIWEGNPDVWSGTAPVLFPIVGKLKNNRYVYDNKVYKMNQHGFARKSKFEVYQKEESAIGFILHSDNDTKRLYPFDFELIVDFEIDEGVLTVSYLVINKGDKQMYFSIGSHPAFALHTNNCKLSDYYIEFEKKETLDRFLIDDGLISKETDLLYLNNENTITLDKDIFNNDALVFKNILSNQISIKNDITGYNLKFNTGESPHLGIWAKPGAPYVCIEPWFGFADGVNSNGNLNKKEGMLRLNPEESFVTGYQIILTN